MGPTQSKKKVEQQFQIYKIEKDGSALLKSKRDSKEYLMRVVTCTSQSDMDRLKALLQCRAQLKSHHLLTLVEIKQKQQDLICSIHLKMHLVLQYSFKNVGQQIKERCAEPQKHYFQESDVWSILYSCCTALNILYSSGATHESITDQQIFINKDGFVKMAEPLLFGLEKNHLEAMRTKQQNVINVHLSPQIMSCLDDQNFFFYDKEKSDIFILGMIIVDLTLLSRNYLYDVAKKRPNLELIPSLLSKVGEKYSLSLVNVLSEMLQIQSRQRPNLQQIIDSVEKCNNIGQDFTVETESNLKSNQLVSSRDQEKFLFQRPEKGKQLSIKQECDIDPSLIGQVINKENQISIERMAVNKFPSYTDKALKYQIINVQQPSLSIKQPNTIINNQTFDGKVFTSTPQQSNQSNQSHISIINNNIPFHNYQKQNPNPNPNNVLIMNTTKTIQNNNNFDLYERSKSIDSIKLASNQYSRTELINEKHPFSAMKTISPFSKIQGKKMQLESRAQSRVKNQPIFTHEIPQVYNILIKSSKMAPRMDTFSKHQKQAINDKQHVSTPQFNGEISKVNRFTSFKNYPYETVSRSGEEMESQSPTFHNIDLKKKFSNTQSQSPPTTTFKRETDNFHFTNSIANNPFFPPKNPLIRPISQTQVNPFALSTPFPSNSVNIPTYPPPAAMPPYTNSTAGIPSYSPIVSSSFIPSYPGGNRQVENFTCHSGFSHMSLFHNNDNENIKLEFSKEEIPDKGVYEGYKFNDKKNGHGTLYFKDGGHYQGEWKNDKMHGFGKLYYQSGKIAYEGHWQNDEFNGQGRVYNSEATTLAGEFNYKDFSQLGNSWIYYEGNFKNDSKHGKGYIKLTNGEMYEGIFDHDMIEGNGIFYKRNGEIIIGFWIDNKLFLNQSYEHEKENSMSKI